MASLEFLYFLSMIFGDLDVRLNEGRIWRKRILILGFATLEHTMIVGRCWQLIIGSVNSMDELVASLIELIFGRQVED